MSVRTAEAVAAELYAELGGPAAGLNPGARVAIAHPELDVTAHGEVVAGVFGSDTVLVRLDGTAALVNLPARLLTKEPR